MHRIQAIRIGAKAPEDEATGNCALFTAGVVMILAACGLIILTHPEVAFVGEWRRALITRFYQASETALNSAAKSSTRPIPKLLHYAFESELIPLGYAQAVNSCLALSPDWKFYLWTTADLLFLLQRSRPDLLQLYSTLLTQREKNSLAKFPVLYSLGGVFLEPDFRCLRPLNEVTNHNEMVSKQGAFLASDRPENHKILENAEFKLSWAAMGTKPGHQWFQFALDLLGGRVQSGNDVNLDESFLTECHSQWQRIRSGKNARTRNDDQESPALLPWQIFSPTLRDPQTMRRLCEQLTRWPSLASVYSARHSACNNSGKSVDSSIINHHTVGFSQYNLRRAVEQSEFSHTAATRNHVEYVNATDEWKPVRYAKNATFN